VTRRSARPLPASPHAANLRTARTAAVLFVVGVIAALALPMLVCIASAGGTLESPAGQAVADESSAALGSISRLLHGDGCVRLDPWTPTELANAGAPIAEPSSAPATPRGIRSCVTSPVIGAEPQRRL